MKVLKINDGKNLKIYLKKLHPKIPQKQTKKCKNLMKYLENKNNITYNKKEVYNRRKGEKQIWKILQVIY